MSLRPKFWPRRGVSGDAAPAVPAAPVVSARTVAPASVRAAPHDYAAEADTLVHYFNFTSDDIAASIAACRADAERPAEGRVAWFIPHTASAFAGGIHTILRVADHMRVEGGVRIVLVILGAPDAQAARARVAEAFPGLAAAAEIVVLDRLDDVPELGFLDAAIATQWMTALSVLSIRDVRRKLYFVQDWEAEFYPASSTSALAEATCRFGFHALCAGPVLAACYRELGGTAEHFNYAADPSHFHDRRPARAPHAAARVLCYGRPGHPRNCFELAAAAMREVKARLGAKVDIVFAGGHWDPDAHGLRGIARNLGMVAHGDMGDVFRAADVAVCLTVSRNPSFMTLELMACGTPVVITRNRHGDWMLGDAGEASGTVLVCEPSRSELADGVIATLNDPSGAAERAARARAVISSRFSDWRPTCEQVLAAVR